jgi:hypothetical protein
LFIRRTWFSATGRVLLSLVATPEEHLLEAPAIDSEIENTHCHTCTGHYPGRQIGINDGVEVVQQEATLIRRCADAGLKILFRQSERTRPRAHFRKYSPGEGKDVQGAPHGAAARPKGSEDYQSEPKKMNG